MELFNPRPVAQGRRTRSNKNIRVRFSQSRSQHVVVFPEFGDLIQRFDVTGSVVRYSRHLGDLTHGSQFHAADLATAFCDFIGHRKDCPVCSSGSRW
jgi:hypothetical protein